MLFSCCGNNQLCIFCSVVLFLKDRSFSPSSFLLVPSRLFLCGQNPFSTRRCGSAELLAHASLLCTRLSLTVCARLQQLFFLRGCCGYSAKLLNKHIAVLASLLQLLFNNRNLFWRSNRCRLCPCNSLRWPLQTRQLCFTSGNQLLRLLGRLLDYANLLRLKLLALLGNISRELRFFFGFDLLALLCKVSGNSRPRRQAANCAARQEAQHARLK